MEIPRDALICYHTNKTGDTKMPNPFDEITPAATLDEIDELLTQYANLKEAIAVMVGQLKQTEADIVNKSTGLFTDRSYAGYRVVQKVTTAPIDEARLREVVPEIFTEVSMYKLDGRAFTDLYKSGDTRLEGLTQSVTTMEIKKETRKGK